MLYQLKYTNDLGQSIIFGGNKYGFVDISTPNTSNNAYRLNKFEGFGDVGADIQQQKAPFQDGSTHIDTLLDDRPLFIEFTLVTDNFSELSVMRRHISSVFNPKISGRLHLTYGDEEFVIDCVPEHVPTFADAGLDAVGHKQIGVIDLLAPNPYWKSPTIQEEPMAAFVELFEFPSDYWELGEDGDIYFEMGTEGHTRTFVNNGDGAVPIKITIKGPTLNPTLTNLTTGELIKINRELSADDVLEISTEDGDKYILLNGENVFNWIDLSSTFWRLEVGENEIQYTADAGLESATLEITWQEQFVGV